MHEQAYKDYLNGMMYKDIAKKYEVSINTVKSWKSRHGWCRGAGADENNAHKKEVCKPKQSRPNLAKALRGNKNAVGNKGGGAPFGSQNAVTHGFYSKYIPIADIDILANSPGAGQLESDLKLARYKLARLLKHQQDKEMQGSVNSADGVLKFSLQDDFYETLIQKQIKLIGELENRIHKMQMEIIANENIQKGDEEMKITIKRKAKP